MLKLPLRSSRKPFLPRSGSKTNRASPFKSVHRQFETKNDRIDERKIFIDASLLLISQARSRKCPRHKKNSSLPHPKDVKKRNLG
ncbi:hypothetical protein NPIL_480511 [Nephila pilipes]|uniref:Uncharacterized protein n=1 Tax=Nephila pilipes TaxID=299642 RepID=A0A8X6TAA7_NEPPI|nr:hypothetical protein NPIL_480511 [Nephila pilipes]